MRECPTELKITMHPMLLMQVRSYGRMQMIFRKVPESSVRSVISTCQNHDRTSREYSHLTSSTRKLYALDSVQPLEIKSTNQTPDVLDWGL